nr:unknown [Medicago truncatula]AFK42231.1 unknown [Medicago truncatula]
MNVTAYGNNVNTSTGPVNATLTGIVYFDKTLAIYHVDKVLIPLDFFKFKALAPAPFTAKAPKADKDSSFEDGDQGESTKATFGANNLISLQGTMFVSLLVAAVTMFG